VAAAEKTSERFTFDSANIEPPKEKVETISKSDTAPDAQVTESEPIGFIDKVLSEKDAPKKVKTPKPAKQPKEKPAPKPKPVKPPKAPKPEAPKKAAPKKAASPQKAKAKKSIFHGDLISKLIVTGKVVIFVAILVFSLYNYLEVNRLNELLDTEVGQQSQNDAKNQELISKIGELMRLPNSDYEVYTVKDKAKLSDDPVFEFAENGDKVVVYADDSLTIVYRESEGKLIDSSKSSSLTEKK
jgi:outer membrane biosynthesis protein TonB